MRDMILEVVNSGSAVKGVDLVIRVMGKTNPHLFNKTTFEIEITKLIQEGEIIELDYKINDGNLKSVYFPKGTKFERLNRTSVNS